MSALSQTAQQPTPVEIFRIIQSYQHSFILKSAVELGVFTAIAKGSATAKEIAGVCGASQRGIRILCDALTIDRLLAKSGDRYSLTPDAAFFLDSRSPAYMGNALKFLLRPAMLENMERLSEAVKLGGAPPDRNSLAPDDPIWVDFARGMAPLMVPAAQAIAQQLQPALAKRTSAKVLDIAAGHGTFGITVAQYASHAHIYAVDWKNVLEVASENATARGVADRYHTIPGSAFQVDYGKDYDAVLVTNFLHHFDPSDNVVLLKKIGAALRPGGQIVILEFVPNDDRVSPPIPALFSVTMLSDTPAGDAYTFTELSEMCRNAGFEGERLIPLSPLPQSLVVAQRPA
jgi:ubiquinone/menaquinone biosynthesis C-methylase UbiE